MIEKLKIDKELMIVLGIMLVGLAARLWAVDYGKPHAFHMEEPQYTHAAQHLACDGNLDQSLLQPHTYAFAAVIWFHQRFPLDDWCGENTQAELPFSMLRLGRLLSVVAGIATIFMVYELGRHLFNGPVGIMAALFLAFNFLHVRESHNGTPDVTTVLCITAALFLYLRLARPTATIGHYVSAGVLTALSVNGRPTAVLLVIAFVVAHLQHEGVLSLRRWKSWPRALFRKPLVIGGIATAATLILITPQIWVNPIGYLRYWRDFMALNQYGGFGRLQVDDIPGWLFYLTSLEWGSGLLLALVMGAGVLWACYRRSFQDVLLLSFAIPYFILASLSKVYFARYGLPLLPVLVILAARFTCDAVSYLSPRLRRVPSAALGLGFSAVLLVVPVTRIVRYSYLLTQTDTRRLAEAWFEENIPNDARILTEWHTVFDQSRYTNVTFVDFFGLSEHDVADYKAEGYEYLVVTSFIRDATMVLPQEEAHKREYYRQLPEEAELVQVFKPYAGDTAPPYDIDQVLGPITYLDQFDRPGPTIEVYRLARP